MNTKLTNAQQIAALKEGDVIKKYPTQGAPKNTLDDNQIEYVETFNLRTINKQYNVLGLVMTELTRKQFPSPGDIGREFIGNSEMLKQNIWWLWTKN